MDNIVDLKDIDVTFTRDGDVFRVAPAPDDRISIDPSNTLAPTLRMSDDSDPPCTVAERRCARHMGTPVRVEFVEGPLVGNVFAGRAVLVSDNRVVATFNMDARKPELGEELGIVVTQLTQADADLLRPHLYPYSILQAEGT